MLKASLVVLGLVAGTDVFAQSWSCDPSVPFTTGLTEAARFVVRD